MLSPLWAIAVPAWILIYLALCCVFKRTTEEQPEITLFWSIVWTAVSLTYLGSKIQK